MSDAGLIRYLVETSYPLGLGANSFLEAKAEHLEGFVLRRCLKANLRLLMR